MKSIFLILIAFAASGLIAQVPDPVITTMSSHNGYATIAGRLNAKTDGPVGISVRNGNLIYSALTDVEGRWGIVIQHQSVNVTVHSWDLKNPKDRSPSVEHLLVKPYKTSQR